MAVIKDVAKLAGLSTSVVSKYLNHPDTVLDDTRKRIEAAIRELDYVPSSTARSLSTKKSKMIAIVIPDIQDEFFTEIFNFMKKYTMERGYTPILYSTEYDSEVLLGDLVKMSVGLFDGILPCYINEVELFEEYTKKKKNFPMIMMNDLTEDNTCPGVTVDLFMGSYQATRHLIEQGYRKIGFVGGDEIGNRVTVSKYSGYTKALREAGLPIRIEFSSYGKSHYREGYFAAKKFFALKEKPDAVVTTNDSAAAGFIKCALNMGLRVPEDIGVVGFDDIILAKIYEPSISTVSIPVQEMCHTAVNMLIDRIEGKSCDSSLVVFEPKLVMRRSSDRMHILADTTEVEPFA